MGLMFYCGLVILLGICVTVLIAVIYTHRRDVGWRKTLEMLQTPEPIPVVCAWCPEYNPLDPINRKATHTICDPCATRLAESDGE